VTCRAQTDKHANRQTELTNMLPKFSFDEISASIATKDKTTAIF